MPKSVQVIALPLPNERATVTVPEFAAAAPCGVASVYTLIHQKQLPVVRIGRKMLIPTKAARKFLGLD